MDSACTRTPRDAAAFSHCFTKLLPSSRSKVVRGLSWSLRPTTQPRTPELACFTILIFYGSLPELLPPGAGRSDETYIYTNTWKFNRRGAPTGGSRK
eukprot:2387859-Pleurochrysis_carterae.AAC.11